MEKATNKRRREKYPDTKYFHFNNPNPKGKLTGDCAIRALSLALNQTWEQTARELAEMGVKYGYAQTETKLIDKYLKAKGMFKHKQPKYDNGSKYTGKAFCECLQYFEKAPFVNVIAKIGAHHIVAIINGRINDTWDSTSNCIGQYWTDSEEDLIIL